MKYIFYIENIENNILIINMNQKKLFIKKEEKKEKII